MYRNKLCIQIRSFTQAFAIAIAAVFLSVSCMKTGGSSSNSTLSIVLPDFAHFGSESYDAKATNQAANQALSYSLQRVMINVSGPSLPNPVVYIWDSSQAGSGTAPPGSFSFTVTQGSGYLVQVLAILQPTGSNGSGSMVFLYGDSTQNLTSAVAGVSVSLAQIGTSSATSAQGAIAGRWLSSSGVGPTGRVNIFYQPPGKPAMIVTKGEIFGGWFQWIALESISFSYALEDGTTLLANNNLDSTNLISGGRANMVVKVPANYRQNNNVPMLSSPWILQLGFFGPGAAGNIMCFDSNAADSMTNLYSNATELPMPWSGSVAPSAAQAGVTLGGLAGANANCQAAAGGTAQYTNWLGFNQAVANNSNNPLPFQGPFLNFPATGNGSGNSLNVVPSGDNLNLSWQYLPQTTGTGQVSAVGLFVRDLPTAPSNNGGNQDYSVDSGVACNRLTDSSFLSQTFTFIGNIPIQNGGAGLQSYSLSGYPLADFNAGKLQIILCPYSSVKSTYFTAAATYAGGNYPPSPQILIAGEQSVLSSTCSTPFTLTYSVNGTATAAPSSTVVRLSSSASAGAGSTVGFYTDATCSTVNQIPMSGGSANFSFPANSATATVYYKESGGMAGQRSLNAQIAGGNVGMSNPFAFATNGMTGTVGQAAVNFNPSGTNNSSSCGPAASPCYFLSGQCVAYNVELMGGSQLTAGTSKVTVALTDSAAGAFYYDSACQNSVSSGALAFNQIGSSGYYEFFKTVYYQSNQTTALPQSGNVTATYSTYTANSYYNLDSTTPVYVNVAQQVMNGMGSSYFAPGACMPMQLSFAAANKEPTSLSTAVSATVTGSANIQFSNFSNCSSPTNSISATIQSPSGGMKQSMSQPFYAITSTTPGAAATITASIQSPSLSTPNNFYLQPTSFAIGNVPFDPNAGNAVGLMQNYCQMITITPQWSSSTPVTSGILPANLNIGLSTTGSGGVYMDPSCTSPTNGLSLSGSGLVGQVYVKTNSTSGIALTANASSGMTTPSSTQSLPGSSTTPSATIVVNNGLAFSPSSCVPIVISLPFDVTDRAGLLLSTSMPGSTDMFSTLYFSSNLCSGFQSIVIPQGFRSTNAWVQSASTFVASTPGPTFEAIFPPAFNPGVSALATMSSCSTSTCSP